MENCQSGQFHVALFVMIGRSRNNRARLEASSASALARSLARIPMLFCRLFVLAAALSAAIALHVAALAPNSSGADDNDQELAGLRKENDELKENWDKILDQLDRH